MLFCVVSVVWKCPLNVKEVRRSTGLSYARGMQSNHVAPQIGNIWGNMIQGELEGGSRLFPCGDTRRNGRGNCFQDGLQCISWKCTLM
jgi:hypothetical protein